MKSLRQILKEAKKNKVAIGHFNISETSALKAIFMAARELNVPVLIGTSEGERDFIGAKQAAVLVKSLREQYDYPIFINADHTHSLEKVKEAVAAGYDAILFDGGKLSLEENIRQTKEVVAYVKANNKKILVEGELGYIGTSSEILKEIPAGAALKLEDLTLPQDAERFVTETGVDLLAPAVGNIHGMLVHQSLSDGGFAPVAINPHLFIDRIKQIKKAAKIPLVLHGGSGTPDEDFIKAIGVGVTIVHINTELRLAWRRGLEAGLVKSKDEVAPYKLLAPALDEMKQIVYNRLKLFSNLK